MKLSEPLEFGHRDRKDLYEYVESHGKVPTERVRDELFPHDERRFRHQLAILKRDGYIEQEEEKLRVIIDHDGETEEFEADGVEFQIRPARQEDLGGVVGAIREVTSERRYIEAESVAEVLDHQDVLLRHNEVESRVFFVAVVGNEVVGWAHIEAKETDKLRHTAEVTFGVIEEYRGYGIGTNLFERAVGWAGENGYEKLYQSIPSTNEDVIEYLEERGCEVEATRENHYKIGDEYVNEVMMAVYPE